MTEELQCAALARIRIDGERDRNAIHIGAQKFVEIVKTVRMEEWILG